MAGNPLGIGLIGCGDIGPAHTKALAKCSGARLVACMDVVESSAKNLAEAHGVAYTTELAALLARPDVDAVTVATPAFTHADIVQQAAEAGKAVLCEKPLATNLREADRAIRVREEAGVPFAICTCWRNRAVPSRADQEYRI